VQVLSTNELVGVVFSGLAPLVVEDVADDGEVIRVGPERLTARSIARIAVVGPVGCTLSMNAQ